MKVALVLMPFYSPSWASIQIGILKSILNNNKIPVDDYYLNLDFAKEIGVEKYFHLSNLCDSLIGDWLFSHEAFGPLVDKESYFLEANKSFINRVSENFNLTDDQLKNWLIEAKDKIVPYWLDKIMNTVDFENYDIVGFSCTFMQVVASIALAEKIKLKNPKIKIIFGGSSVEGEMGIELIKKVKTIDYIVQGEGENAIIELVKRLRDKKFSPSIYKSDLKTNLNEIPIPDYSTYYDLLDNDPHLKSIEQITNTGIPLETSRGCWWGEKHHCKFCGLNGETMEFRFKEIDKTLVEMDHLTKKHHRYYFQAVDNILGMKHFKKMLPAIVGSGLSYSLFFEVKSNLNYKDIKLLKDAGVESIQPGIESLHTEVLKLMNKGTSRIQNLNTLKWGKYFDIDIAWNFLYGFPGEKKEYYEEMMTLIPKLFHLQPPSGAHKIRLDRFSPYFNEYQQQLKQRGNNAFASFFNVKPSINYSLIYPEYIDPWKISFFYESEANTEIDNETYERFNGAIERWKKFWKKRDGNGISDLPKLVFKKSFSSGHIIDSRLGTSEVFHLEENHFKVARIMEHGPCSIDKIQNDSKLSVFVIENTVNDFIENNFVIYADNRFLWLPISDKYSETSHL